MTSRRRNNVRPPRAFTLPEVLASLVLVGLVLPAVMKCVSLSMAASDDARKRTEAVALAEQKLAEMVASATATSSGSTAGDFGAERPGFRWEASMAAADTSLTEVRVRVVWHGRGTDRSVDLATFAYTGAGSAGSLGTVTGGTAGTGGTGGGATP
jgi:prepilin-type N-terminal cleavage/methylation domain-containing protein